MYVLPIVAILALTAAFAYDNQGTEVFHLFGYARTLPTWAPTIIGVGAASALLVVVTGFTGLSARFRDIGHARELHRHRTAIEELRAENARLRGQVAAHRGQLTPPR